MIGCALAVSRVLYQQLNGFDADMRFWGVEDIDFGLKSSLMGCPILHDPRAVVGHRFRQSFDNFSVPGEHVIANQLRFARKHFSSAVWNQWVEGCRMRSDNALADHPEGLWARAWQLFEERRASVEQERHFLHSRRVHDEFWYAEKFGLKWPRLLTQSGVAPVDAAQTPSTSDSAAAPAGMPATVGSSPVAPVRVRPMLLSPSPSPSPPPGLSVFRAPCDPMAQSCPKRGVPRKPAPNGVVSNSCPITSSNRPIRYATGEVEISAVDLSSEGFGAAWQHRRVYSNIVGSQIGQGNYWLVFNWPYLTSVTDQPPLIDAIQYVRGTEGTLWFQQIGGSGAYLCQFGGLATLEMGSDHTISIIQPSGYTQVFNDFSGVNGYPGIFVKQIEPGGQVTQVTSYYLNRIGEIQRSVTVGGVTTIESFLYTYNSDDLLATATLRRQVGGGAWSNVRQAVYTYYGSGDSNGSFGDLKLVEIQLPDGSGWTDFEVTYYRYYTVESPPGIVHGLKYVVEPATYQAMMAASIDPTTALDSTLFVWADYHFEYDGFNRATFEGVYRGSQEFEFGYTDGTSSTDYNVWNTKTVETLPDENQNVVYTNWIGQILVKAFVSGSESWIEAWQYDTNGREVLHAFPSAVVGYNDSDEHLAIEFQSSSGLIENTSYYTGTTGGAAPGYPQSVTIQQGSSGTPISVLGYTYNKVLVGGIPIYPIASVSKYQNTDGTGVITTSVSDNYYSGTWQRQLQTTTLPAILTTQNGSGSSNSNQVFFDAWDRATWLMDERGFITNLTYDNATGGLIQRIDDVNTSITSGAPAGWSNTSGLNLVTDIQVDNLGRMTEILGPSNTIDLVGVATTVRSVTWIIYQDATYQTWIAQGYATGTGPSYTYFMYNPVTIIITDAQGRVLEQIAATRGSGTTSSGPLSASDSYPQSTYVNWITFQYLDCCFVASKRVYKLIPTSGDGTSGLNYDEVDFGYDIMKRLYRTVTPGGTITDLVFDPRGLVLGAWIGTKDDGATPTDPTGGGAPGNNMVQVVGGVYDGGVDGGDGNLTQLTQYVDGTTTRVRAMTYDFRDRLVTTDGEIDYFQKLTYDNLDEVIQVDRYNTTASGNLIGRVAVAYDYLSRVYQQTRYAVDPATGTVGNGLVDNFWYDERENVIKSYSAGSHVFIKASYDSLGRKSVTYAAYGADSSYADALTVANNTVLEQVETAYDSESNVIMRAARRRYHNAAATQLGPLGDPGTTPYARVLYIAYYPDGIGRIVTVANYGTNAGSPLTPPSVAPAPSDTILVSSAAYDITGMVYTTTDPAGMVTQFLYDAAGRKSSVTENYGGSTVISSCTSSDDTNRVAEFAYTADGELATVTAVNARTGNQTTTYTRGTTLTESSIATSFLLRFVDYPDSTEGPGGTDSVAYTYNRQSELTSLTDQRGCVHEYVYDLLARLTNDCVTTLGSGVDGTVLQLAVSYEVRGLVSHLTSYNDATPGSGTIVNDVALTYNSFAQLVTDAQSHSGAVGVGSPQLEYEYEDGSANTIRPIALIYPNERKITIAYGATGGINDSTGQVDSLIDSDSTVLVSYQYLGLGTAVLVTCSQPGIQYTLLGSGTGPSPAGDIYWGLDLFSRIIDSRSFNTSTSADVDRIKYGFDRASNRTWRQNPVATAAGAQFDEFYTNDGLQRLKDMERGTLNGTETGLTTKTLEQCFTLDPTGNWAGFNESTNGSSWTTVQTRTANPVNEITNITNTTGAAWVTPAYDAAGNMTTIPTGLQVQDGWSELTVDEWAALTVDGWATLPVSRITDKYTGLYDSWNRLVKVADAETGNTVQQNQYDARNFRTIIQAYADGALSETRHSYFSSDWRCIEERVGTATTAERQFVWGNRYIDDIVLRDFASQRFYALQDANWNVTSIADIAGMVQERYSYTAYGIPGFLSNTFATTPASAYGWETLYAGYRFNGSTGLLAARNRSLIPQLGVWLTRDLLGGQNLYLYADNPLTGADPLGLALIAVDGTGTKEWLTGCDNPKRLKNQRWLSHVRNFRDDYKGKKTYLYGPSNGITGSDITGLINDAYKAACEYHCDGEPIDLIGWSRGGLAVNEVARKLHIEGCSCDGGKTSHQVRVRFLGLYDPVDMTWYAGTNDNVIPPNVDAVANVYGFEDPSDTYKGVDYDRGIGTNWPRMNKGYGHSIIRDNYTGLPLNATHGAIGGCPGYSGKQQPNGYSYTRDRRASIEADQAIRRAANKAGVPIEVLNEDDYGFPKSQSQLPPIMPNGGF